MGLTSYRQKREGQYFVPKTMEEWEQVAKIYGLKKEKPLWKKAISGGWSAIKTGFDIISRPLYSIAGAAKAYVNPEENILEEAWKGLMGKERETFSDVLKEVGVKNKYVRGIVGFALDVAFDPITYIGGAGLLKRIGLGGRHLTKAGREVLKIATKKTNNIKKVLKVTQGVIDSKDTQKLMNLIAKETARMNKILRGNPNKFFKGLTFMGKEIIPRKTVTGAFGAPAEGLKSVFPKVYNKISVSAHNLKDALGKAFMPSYKVSQGFSAKVYGAKHFIQKEADVLTTKWYKILGKTDDLGKKEIAESFFAVKQRYWDIMQEYKGKAIKRLDKLGVKVSANLTPEKVNKLIDKIERVGVKKSAKLITDIDTLRKFTKPKWSSDYLKQLDNIYDDLLKQIREEAKGKIGKKITKVAGLTEEEFKITKKIAVSFGETIKENDILKGKALLETIRKKPFGKVMKVQRLKIGQKINKLEKELFKIQDNITKKQGLFNQILNSRQVALEKVNKLKPYDLYKMRASTKQLIEKDLLPELENLAVKYGYKGNALKYYMPSIDKSKFDDLIKRTIVDGLSEKEIARWGNKILDENLLKKPFEAYVLKERLLARNAITRHTLTNLVDIYGISKKQFSKLDDTAKALYKQIKLIGDKSPIGYLKNVDAKFVNNALFPEMKTIDMLARASGYDGFTNLFKKAVTAWFPAFHLRNMMSGFVQNYEVLGATVWNPLSLRDSLRGMANKSDDLMRLGRVTMSAKQLNKAVTDRFYAASRYISDFAVYADDMLKIKHIHKLNPRRLGNFIEMHQKMHATVVALKKGYGIDDALRIAEKAGFDYTVMTKFEQSIMKRLVPFYSFARKNAGLQLATFVENPARILNQKKALDMFSEILGGGKISENDIRGLPEWVQESLGFKVSEGKIISSFDLPIKEFLERVSDPLKTSITSMNPLIKFPVEALSGYDFFRGRPIKK